MKRNTKICPKCNCGISLSNFKRHFIKCEGTIKSKYPQDLICPFCGKKYNTKMSYGCHISKCPKNLNRNYKNGMIGRKPWNKGLTKETSEKVAQCAKTYQKNKEMGLHKVVHRIDGEEINQKRRKKALENIISGKVKPICHSRAKHGFYKGIYCDSLWELCFVIYCEEAGIKIKRNTKSFKYIFENQEHLYFPDFYNLEEKLYIEIKGYKDKKFFAKQEQFPEKLILLEKKEMKPIIEYVEKKYGTNLEKLYDMDI